MNVETSRTSWARAVAGYDDDFRRHLDAIAKTSLVTDANVMAIRTGETLEALISCLIATAALTPQFADNTAKRIRLEVDKARAEGLGEDFIFSARWEGNA